ncbi:membrane protein insertase YidC [Gleimia europaea]|uniref:Membrane protein insertase YidC n=1 Tax=Gleimia europaea ACS-120-V-Col10b TaxID=883069 RepID=A0A9W5VWY1_9ACTO|nr:membrane protein insertase YidC [Gleimia europaea]EPD31339.1 YidC/Oxa1 family membrane protein insertase [Gleimia europaea ACS-120-V-Col10b]
MWFDKLLYPFKVAVAWVMVRLHDVFVFLGMDDGSGPAWVLSIIGLTIIVRILLIPLFFKQIKASRGMQALQPELKKLQDKYKNKKDQASRQRMSEEMMALYKEHGTSPYSSCLPVLLQMPVFFALFRVLASTGPIAEGTYQYKSLGPLTASKAAEIEGSSLFGAPLSATFPTAEGLTPKIVIVVMIVLMVITQFITMRQLTMKNMPESAKDPSNPMMRSQQMMMYTMPLIMGVSGFFFQTGVLVYWFTTNLWTMGQQFWTIAQMPTPGSDAYIKLMGKRRKAYIEWARPVFEEYDNEVRKLDAEDEQGRADLVERTLKKVKKSAPKQKIPTKFGVDVTAEQQLGAYRELAYSEWDGMPDERWIRKFEIAKRNAEAAKERNQPQRLTKRERQARDQAERRRRERERQIKERQQGMSPEELERKREERRQQRRNAARKKKQGKDQNNQA